MKKCYTCEKELTEDNFHKNKLKKDGLDYQCKKCASARADNYYKTHKERILSRNRTKYHKDPEHKLVMNRRWYQNNKERHKELRTNWYQNHKKEAFARWGIRKERQHKAGGVFTKADKILLFNRYNNKCLSCGATKGLVADHITPVSLGGSNDISNRQPLCFSCNAKKFLKIIDYRYETKI